MSAQGGRERAKKTSSLQKDCFKYESATKGGVEMWHHMQVSVGACMEAFHVQRHGMTIAQAACIGKISEETHLLSGYRLSVISKRFWLAALLCLEAALPPHLYFLPIHLIYINKFTCF